MLAFLFLKLDDAVDLKIVRIRQSHFKILLVLKTPKMIINGIFPLKAKTLKYIKGKTVRVLEHLLIYNS